ncbi:hypothetical protein CERZMDRAFT_84267 [Cercospora zeae-maydis SCOH1-5]|uniref:Uncharacterized protein n=1 Tax=Cercospora zeae-maydis SCOH1-5 TaxID=717836 RepID=A0A6A6FGQ2_9PEZI|nr:hypothetical protein CERZMDRAFT_84267 [Cercospora zeae-maydis SCOH1-5]
MDQAVIDPRKTQISFTLPATLLQPILAAESPDQVDSETTEGILRALKTRLSKHQQDGSGAVPSAPHVIDLEAGASLQDAIEIESDDESIPADDTCDDSVGTVPAALQGRKDGYREHTIKYRSLAGENTEGESRAGQDERMLRGERRSRSRRDEGPEAYKNSRSARKRARRRQAKTGALGGMLLDQQAFAGGARSPHADGQWSQPEGLLLDEAHELTQHRVLAPQFEPDSSALNHSCDSSGALQAEVAQGSYEKAATNGGLLIESGPTECDHVTDDLLRALGV